MRKSWTDERLDDFRLNVEQRFDQVDKRFEQVDMRFEQIDRRFEQVEGEIRTLRDETKQGFEVVAKSLQQIERQMHADSKETHRLLAQCAIGMAAALATVIAGLLGLIATQI